MFTYNSTLKGSAPFSDDIRARMQRDLSGASPYAAYRGNAADVFRSASAGARENVEATGNAANFAHASRVNDAQRQLALSGLQMMADGQQRSQDVANARLSGVNGLLSGLFA